MDDLLGEVDSHWPLSGVQALLWAPASFSSHTGHQGQRTLSARDDFSILWESRARESVLSLTFLSAKGRTHHYSENAARYQMNPTGEVSTAFSLFLTKPKGQSEELKTRGEGTSRGGK